MRSHRGRYWTEDSDDKQEAAPSTSAGSP
jgi:hypothetical protein